MFHLAVWRGHMDPNKMKYVMGIFVVFQIPPYKIGILRKKRNKSFAIFLSVWWNFSKLAWRSLSVKILSNERKYHDVLCVVWTTNLTIITAVIKIINLSNASWSSTSKVLSLSKLAHYGAKNILNAHLNFETLTIWGNIC